MNSQENELAKGRPTAQRLEGLASLRLTASQRQLRVRPCLLDAVACGLPLNEVFKSAVNEARASLFLNEQTPPARTKYGHLYTIGRRQPLNILHIA